MSCGLEHPGVVSSPWDPDIRAPVLDSGVTGWIQASTSLGSQEGGKLGYWGLPRCGPLF